MLVPPHVLVSTAFKKMRWKDEFRKWLPKLSSLAFNDTCLYVCMYVCMYVFIKLHITTQSGPVILVILCHSH